MTRFKIFLIDDEESVQKGILFEFRKKYDIRAFSMAEEALAVIQTDFPDLILLDIGLPGMSGIDALKEIMKIDPAAVVIMTTAFEDVETVIQAMKAGARDYVIKPIRMESLRNSIENALETVKLRKEVRELQEKYIRENMPCLIGESNVIQDVIQVVKKVAKSPDTPIMIIGESGTGKELIAKTVHYNSPNFKGPFVTLNCAAIPKDLLESELFGYEKGAFSGARTGGKTGLIEEAENGTLFLDEVGDLSLEGQAKLLRFIEEGEYYRVGGTRKHTIRTRIVSATNKDLKDQVENQLFRLDLYYRLAVVKIDIPSLNDRKEDILPIAKHFIQEFARKFGKTMTAVAEETERFLVSRSWGGNIRELKNFIEREMLLQEGPEFRVRDQDVSAGTVRKTQSGFAPLPESGLDLAAMEEHYIREAIQRAGGNDREAAELLKMSYYTFRYRKKKLAM